MTSGANPGQGPDRMDQRRVALYLLAIPLVLFLPAGNWAWPRGWRFVPVFTPAMVPGSGGWEG